VLLPRLYVILDGTTLARAGLSLLGAAEDLLSAGVGCLQYRDKQSEEPMIRENAKALSSLLSGTSCRLILNDYPRLVQETGADGVHLGQGDERVDVARALLGADRLIGLSTHTDEQVVLANSVGADYVAIGPVFATATKRNPEPVIALEGVARARRLTSKHLVAIGGISLASAKEVVAAGADSVAVVGAILSTGRPVRLAAQEFLQALL